MHSNSRAFSPQRRRVQRHARASGAYSFFNLLTGPELFEKVESLLPEHRERLFPPTETLSIFLAQALNADRSCQKAVDETAVRRVVAGLPVCSTHTGAYCRARARLPMEMVRTLEADLKAHNVNAEVEIYPDSDHGFAFPERPAFQKESAERHWARLHALFARNLLER